MAKESSRPDRAGGWSSTAAGIRGAAGLAALGTVLLGGFSGPGRTAPDARGPLQDEAGIPVDRWLVSEPLAEASPAIEADTSTFPDRDLTVAGTYWELLRRDSAAAFELDDLLGERDGAGVVYAHAYIRSPEDRTVRLAVSGPTCGGARVWLNAQPLERPAREAGPAGSAASGPDLDRPVRLGLGWNTLLVRLRAGDCPTRVSARLARVEPGGSDGAEAPAGGAALDGVRVQASRPPGVRRDWPDPFVGVVGVRAERIVWPAGDDGLRAHLTLELAAWGASDRPPTPEEPGTDTVAPEPPDRPDLPEGRRGPPEGAPGRRGPPPEGDPRARRAQVRNRLQPPPPALPAPETVELRAEAAGGRAAGTFPLARPGLPTAVDLAFPFGDVREAALSGDGIELELRWTAGEDGRERELRRPLAPASVLEAVHAAIELAGWRESGGGRVGEWTVPEMLAGFSLELLPEAGADARVGGEPVAREDGRLPLCSPCRRGQRLSIELPGGDGGEQPRVRIVEAGQPSAAGQESAPPAARWLEAFGKDGNREYLELAERFAGGGAGTR